MSCANCYKGSLLPGTPTGTLVSGAYLAAGSPTRVRELERTAIVLLTDPSGLPGTNCKIVADTLAQRLGVDVWVPDLFNGKPPIKAETLEPYFPDRAGQNIGFIATLKLVLLLLWHAWPLYKNRPSVGLVRASEFIRTTREERGYEKVGAVGYCYGGTLAIELGASDLVNSIVVAHPDTADLKAITAIKVPSSWICAEDDAIFKTVVRREAEAIFAARHETSDFTPYEFKDWKGTAHGFALRPNLAVPDVKAAYEGALEQTAAWFHKTLGYQVFHPIAVD